jgi:hypothetical protein
VWIKKAIRMSKVTNSNRLFEVTDQDMKLKKQMNILGLSRIQNGQGDEEGQWMEVKLNNKQQKRNARKERWLEKNRQEEDEDEHQINVRRLGIEMQYW